MRIILGTQNCTHVEEGPAVHFVEMKLCPIQIRSTFSLSLVHSVVVKEIIDLDAPRESCVVHEPGLETGWEAQSSQKEDRCKEHSTLDVALEGGVLLLLIT